MNVKMMAVQPMPETELPEVEVIDVVIKTDDKEKS